MTYEYILPAVTLRTQFIHAPLTFLGGNDIFLNDINRLVFVMEAHGAFFYVQTESLSTYLDDF
jgi:hypothetical protein